MTKFIPLLSVVAALLCVAISRAGQAYVVSETTGGHLWRIEDANGDSDALDVGERTLWGEGFSLLGMTADSQAIYVTEAGRGAGSNQVVRLLDANRDGDALDIGERTIWLDGLDNPRDISFDGGDTWYLSELATNQIWRLIDANNDGDALDVGEKLLFADGISQPQWNLPQNGMLLVASTTGHQIHRLMDTNGDGDALDVAENLVIITANDNELVGLLDDGDDGYYFSSFGAHTVYHAHDINGDGDMLDVAEVLNYADPVYGLLEGPVGLAAFDGGGLLVADLSLSQLKLARDINGDGDALDIGDVVLFADGTLRPSDIVALPFGLPGDYNNDGTVNAADYTVYRNRKSSIGGTTLPNDAGAAGVTIADYNYWKAHYGEPNGSGAILIDRMTDVPEPATMLLAWLAIAFFPARRRNRNLDFPIRSISWQSAEDDALPANCYTEPRTRHATPFFQGSSR